MYKRLIKSVSFILFLIPAIHPALAEDGLRKVTFRFQPVIGGVETVSVAGTFNDWRADKHPMNDADGDGVFTATLTLQDGKYFYKLVVDGNWITDPANPETEEDHNGKVNSVLIVDASYESMIFKRGDGKIATHDIPSELNYGMVNPFDENTLIFTTRTHAGDVDSVFLVFQNDGKEILKPMLLSESARLMDYYQVNVSFDKLSPLHFMFIYQDGAEKKYLTPSGFLLSYPQENQMYVYSSETMPVFSVPDWVKDGVFYQIFPDRFCNGDPQNDPDFTEAWYEGKNILPPSGKINGDYFHLVHDWNDVDGLTKSPYRTDGKPDYFSFYGGDIQGVIEKLPYLKDLGVTIIYFNPLAVAKSNHKYDPIDYMKLDPHFADEATFRQFVSKAHEMGIRIIVDKAFNHTGDEHYVFMDTREKGEASKYWHWYEWHKWPLPEEGCSMPCDYYDCWWGFPLHPNLNYDLSRANDQENNICNIEDADPNMDVVNHVLDVARYWLGDLGIDGFRLDVPNEVPHWFWKEFRRVVDEINPEAFLIGEIWGNALPWMGPDGFHVTMNYKYFRDPVLQFFARGEGSAKDFDQALAPGRVEYPIQAVQGMMNLIDSHDTERFLFQAKGDIRKLKLAALFQMTYVGIPQIYYGDEVALTGGKDPDNRRTFPWHWQKEASRRSVHDFYIKLIQLRHEISALRTGSFKSIYKKDKVFAYLRENADDKILIVLNNENQSVNLLLDLQEAGFENGQIFQDLIHPQKIKNKTGLLKIHLNEYSAVILKPLK